MFAKRWIQNGFHKMNLLDSPFSSSGKGLCKIVKRKLKALLDIFFIPFDNLYQLLEEFTPSRDHEFRFPAYEEMAPFMWRAFT